MSDERASRLEKKTPLGGDLVIPVAAIIFCLYYFSTILESPWTAQVSAFFVGSILVLLSLAFIIRSALEIRRGQADLGLRSLVSVNDLRSGRLGLLAATLGYVVFIEWGGFTLTTFGFLFAGMAILNRGRNKGFIFALSAVMAIGGYLLFILAFDTRFPRGPFESLAEAVLSYGS